jgi:glycosyltransferase involved in cell wall biosynthesis
MRIALVTDTYLPEVNGVTTVLARMRRGLRDRGHEIEVIAPAYPHPGPDDEGVIRRPSVPCPGYSAVRLSWPWTGAVRRELDRFQPDLVHVVTEGPLGRLGRRHALTRGLPLVTSFHTDFPRYARHYFGAWAVRPARRYLRRFHEAALATHTPSEITQGELVSLGLTQAVVGAAAWTVPRSPLPGETSRRNQLVAGERPLILHVGRLAAEKDVDTLIRTFILLHAVLGQQAAFCVAGDGPKAAAVRAALPFAWHKGFLPRETLADLYADSDLFVFPSPSETCGLVALEAMSSCLPVIAAAAGGVRENVRDGLTGRLVPAGDAHAFAGATRELVETPEERAAMAQAARAFAQARDWDCELDALTPLYQAALERGRTARRAVGAAPPVPLEAASGSAG